MPKVNLGAKKKTTSEIVAERIRMEIARVGSCKTNIATSLGFKQATFCNRMNKPETFQLAELERIAKCFKTTVAELCREEKNWRI